MTKALDQPLIKAPSQWLDKPLPLELFVSPTAHLHLAPLIPSLPCARASRCSIVQGLVKPVKMLQRLVLLVGWAFSAVTARVNFVNVEYDIEQGKPFTLRYEGCDSGCTITLMTGAASDLRDVEVLTSELSSYSGLACWARP